MKKLALYTNSFFDATKKPYCRLIRCSSILRLFTIITTFLFVSFNTFAQPGGIAVTPVLWLRADMGTTGTTPLTAWTNQGTGNTVSVNGLPNLNTTSTSYNYNPYVDFTAPTGYLDGGINANRQCILLNGHTGISGENYGAFFWASHLIDLTRSITHLATVRGISTGGPANGTLCGGDNGGLAAYQLGGYDPDYDIHSPAGTWNINGVGTANNTLHLTTKQIVSANSTGGTSTTNTIWGGQNDRGGFQGHTRDWRGPAAEVITFLTNLTTNERQRVHTYLGIKYGATLSHNYLSTTNSLIYDVSNYNNNIIGIGRDDIEQLYQKQSHTDDDSTRIYRSTLATSNIANTGTFNDFSYIIMGDNQGAMNATPTANAEMPTGLTGCALYSRLEREWKVTKTSTGRDFNWDVTLNTLALPTAVNVAHLRLLVDDDGNFSSGGSCYYNGDGTGIVISYNNPVITVTGISNTHISNNSTAYITIASINSLTPLPVELVQFDVKCKNEIPELTWSTASEINNDYFTIERSTDGNNFEEIATVNGNGNSSITSNYNWKDASPIDGTTYYRLKQTDFNGDYEYHGVRAITCEQANEITIYPNPFENSFTISLSENTTYPITVKVIDYLGREVHTQFIEMNATEITLDRQLPTGTYFIKVFNETTLVVERIVKMK